MSQPPTAGGRWWGRVSVHEQVRLARDTYRLRLACPELARMIVPGQFVMLRLAGCNDPLLGRPLALYDTWCVENKPVGLDIVYLAVGKLTRRLAQLEPGAPLEIWGPLGNGFPPAPPRPLLLAAGGIGQTPFLAVAREHLGLRRYGVGLRYPSAERNGASPGTVTLCYGTRTAELLAGVDDFEALGVNIRLSTDDGTAGYHGLVTDLVAYELASSRPSAVYCCGPEPMMAAVAKLASRAGVPCLVSLETPMACGIGVCFSCVARIRQPDGGWDYQRTCVAGPVFDASQVVWDAT
jgi:dihydroorotate dehydrogenase electron transfer subunit